MSAPIEKNRSSEQPGLVISYFGNSVAVEAADGQVFQCHLHRNQDLPVVGDQVVWQLGSGDTGTVSSIVPRRSLLSRGDGRGKMKPLAANIDAIVIVMAPSPIFSEYLVDRYLVAAELVNIQPVLVLNKTDLLDPVAKQAALHQLTTYKQIPYPVFLTCAITDGGLDELTHYLAGKNAVLVGPSGVGKSSIISALSSDAIRTTAVSAKGAGKHTTTATRLYHLPQGGSLIDSPGVREFSLWEVSQGDVLRGFKEMAAQASKCRYKDCSHLVEPDCAVREALSDGKISETRYTSYQTLLAHSKEKVSYDKNTKHSKHPKEGKKRT